MYNKTLKNHSLLGKCTILYSEDFIEANNTMCDI